MSSGATLINTAKVVGRRKLHFQSFEDVLRELTFLEGKHLRVQGNWSVGQILYHLSIPIDGAVDGLPFQMPWYLRWGATMLKPLILRMKMPAGFKLPPDAAAKMVPPPTAEDVGYAALRRSISRFREAKSLHPHPIFGRLSPRDWEQIMCRHCELHLSFITPEN